MDIQKCIGALIKGHRRHRKVKAVQAGTMPSDAVLRDIGLLRIHILAASVAPNNRTHQKSRESIMKPIATAFTALMIFAGTVAADNTFPCSKLQLWVTSLPTVVTDHERFTASQEISIANIVLRGKSAVPIQVAQK